MSVTTGFLSRAYERTQTAKTTLKYARLVHEHCHQVADHLLALADYNRLHPAGWDASTFLELRLELGLLDSALALLERTIGAAEHSLDEATATLTEAVVFEKLGATAPTKKNGATIDEFFDDHIARVQVETENMETLNSIYMDHAKTVRDMLGI